MKVVIVFIVLTFIYYALEFAKSKLIFHPYTPVTDTPNVPFEDFNVFHSDNKIHGWRVGNDQSKPTIFMCHGNAGSISNRIPFIETAYKNGFNIIVFDYRCYGNSVGCYPTEKGLYEDAMRVWSFCNPKNCIIYGESIGASVATKLTSVVNDKPRALVLQSGFSAVEDFLVPPFSWVCPEFKTKEFIKNVNCPVLILHSKNDGMIPYTHAEMIYNSANEPKKLVEISGTHNNPDYKQIITCVNEFTR